jgi:uncharacterized protein (DUF2267 family)
MATHYFDHYASEANTFLARLAEDIHEPENQQKAHRVTLAVLHTLRDRITIQESFQLMAQLPLFLKAMYVTEWKYGKEASSFKHLNEFVDAVKSKYQVIGEKDFGDQKNAEFVIKMVFKALGQYVTTGEWHDILDNLPRELHPLLKPAIHK